MVDSTHTIRVDVVSAEELIFSGEARFVALPGEAHVLETDAPDMLPPSEFITHPIADGINHPANLPTIGQALAKSLGLKAGELAELTRVNALECFTPH